MPKEKNGGGKFHIDFKSSAQKIAWSTFQQHDVLFLSGPAGTGKTYLATAFALSHFFQAKCRKIVMTRPIVEAEEKLGYLPGDFHEKVHPYMLPLYDSIDKLVGVGGPQRERLEPCLEIAPLAYMRGRTLDDAVCILDEAQNATKSQLKLFLTRIGRGSKIIVTGDPTQTDIGAASGLVDVMQRLESVPGVGSVSFTAESIERHPIIGLILERLA